MSASIGSTGTRYLIRSARIRTARSHAHAMMEYLQSRFLTAATPEYSAAAVMNGWIWKKNVETKLSRQRLSPGS